MRKIVIIGAGGHGCAVAEAARLSGEYEVIGFVDDGQSMAKLGIPVLGNSTNLEAYRSYSTAAIVAIGNNVIREELSRRVLDAGFELISVIHPRAIISPSAVIGGGSAVMAGAVVGTEARLGSSAILNAMSVADHHTLVEDFGHLGVGACMAGGAVLRRGAWVQAGCALGYGVDVASGMNLPPGTALG